MPARAVTPFVQYVVLAHRNVYDAVKDRTKLAKSLFMRLLVGLGIGVLFLGQVTVCLYVFTLCMCAH